MFEHPVITFILLLLGLSGDFYYLWKSGYNSTDVTANIAYSIPNERCRTFERCLFFCFASSFYLINNQILNFAVILGLMKVNWEDKRQWHKIAKFVSPPSHHFYPIILALYLKHWCWWDKRSWQSKKKWFKLFQIVHTCPNWFKPVQNSPICPHCFYSILLEFFWYFPF